MINLNIRNAVVCLATVFLSVFSFAAEARDYTSAECPVIGNTKSMIYHLPNCPNYKMMLIKNAKGDNRMCFSDQSSALRSGFRKAKNCKF